MNVETISTEALDSGINEFLKPYIADGRANGNGALLIQSMAPSRPREVRPVRHPLQDENIEFASVTVSPVLLPGLYSIKYCFKKAALSSLQDWKTRAAQGGDIRIEELMQIMSSGQSFGDHFGGIDMTSLYRSALGVRYFPIHGNSPALRSLAQEADWTGLKSHIGTITTPGSLIHVHTSIANTQIHYYNHQGSPINWLVVPPSDRDTFELRIRNVFAAEIDLECSQFINHLSLWLSPDLLKSWGIEYRQISQEARQIVVIFPGSYVWAWASGFTILEKSAHACANWSFENYKFCNLQSNLCRKAHPPNSSPKVLCPADLQRTFKQPAQGRKKKLQKDQVDENANIDPKLIEPLAPQNQRTYLQANNSNTPARHEAAMDAMDWKDQQIHDLTKALESARRLNEQREASIHDLQMALGGAMQRDNRIKQLTTALKVQQSRCDELVRELAFVQNTRQEIENEELENAREQIAQLEQKLAEVRAVRDEQEGYIEEQERHVDVLKRQLKAVMEAVEWVEDEDMADE